VTRCGSAASVLLEQAVDADLVVVGNRGYNALHGIIAGSVSSRVARHAPVPVVVVRGASEPPPEFEPRVVVGFDGSAPGEAALAFAFREASLHGVPLTVVGVWPSRASVHGAPFMDEVSLRATAHDRFLAEISVRQADFPDVETRSWFPDGAPVSELLAAAAPARLLVVGEHDAHGMRTLFPDALLRSLLHNAPCPIAVVHPTSGQAQTIDRGDAVPTAVE
jgi:nucleotide-binding universal stress UspA family protein